jgi:hypothetical protein
LLPAVFFFAWGKYLEFRQPDPFDGGSYIYSAEHLLRGARLGVEEWPAAQPGTLLVNVLGVYCLGFRETGPEIIQMLLQIGALAAMWSAVRSLYGKAAAVFSVTVAAIYLSAPHIAKFGNTKEQYMIAMMVVAASFWIFYEQNGRIRWLLLTGAALIWPYYFKATGLTIDIALGVYFLARALFGGISGKRLQKELLILIGGAWLGLIPLAIFFLWQRQFGMLWNSFPALMLRTVLFLDILGIVVFYLVRLHPARRLARWCRRVRPAIWILGLFAVLIVTGVGALLVYKANGGTMEDVQSYLGGLFFVRIPQGVALRVVSFWNRILTTAGAESAYIVGSRRMFSLSRQAPIVLRYYASLSLPVAASLVSILWAFGVWCLRILRKKRPSDLQDRLVWLLMMWWMLDMGFAWISPHSYEQYYLPLCASGAMLGGYAVWNFVSRLESSSLRAPYLLGAAAVLIVMIGMIWPLVFGYKTSAYSGQPYGRRWRGYVQFHAQARSGPGAWQKIGDYIRRNTKETDRIYVWGWYPGIYVQAQRMAPVPRAFEAEMHTPSPGAIAGRGRVLLERFEQDPPAVIVDTRKQHFDRPPLELWPVLQIRQGGQTRVAFAPHDPEVIASYEKTFRALLEKQYGSQEAGRFDAMKPLRDYVMTHYRIVPELSSPSPGEHTLLKRRE